MNRISERYIFLPQAPISYDVQTLVKALNRRGKIRPDHANPLFGGDDQPVGPLAVLLLNCGYIEILQTNCISSYLTIGRPWGRAHAFRIPKSTPIFVFHSIQLPTAYTQKSDNFSDLDTGRIWTGLLDKL